MFTITDKEPKADSIDVKFLSFKLPSSTPGNTRVRLRQIEDVSSTSRITSERPRYSFVLQSPPFDVGVDAEDLLDPITAGGPYTRLKDAVIQHVVETANRMLREIFTQDSKSLIDLLRCENSAVSTSSAFNIEGWKRPLALER
nr:unnamed protein product [Spirometra erinaceieuropaei]